jgi:hypothetical protein
MERRMDDFKTHISYQMALHLQASIGSFGSRQIMPSIPSALAAQASISQFSI